MRIKKRDVLPHKKVNEIKFKIPACLISDNGRRGKFINCTEAIGSILDHAVNPETYLESIGKYDIFFVNATIKSLRCIPTLKEAKKKIVVILECSNMFRSNSYLNSEINQCLNQADLIIAQFGEPYLSIVKSYLDPPIEFLGLTAGVNDIYKQTKIEPKIPKAIHVRCLVPSNAEFNPQTNFAICRYIQEKLPNVTFYTGTCSKVFKHYLNNVEEFGKVGQNLYWQIIQKCSLAIDMSSRITWGRHFIECCSLHTPCIGSYNGAADYCNIPYFGEFDVDRCVSAAMNLLLNPTEHKIISDQNFNKIQKLDYVNQFHIIKQALDKYII